MLDLIDVLLAAAVLWSAWRAVTAPTTVTAVVSYIVFGLLLSLAWVRLDAPDVALAEAAIGAGLTGALLLEAAAPRGSSRSEARARPRGARRPLLAVLAAALAGVLALAVAALPEGEPGLAPAVAERIDEAAVQQPVTAVLLDFRSWDTLLEVGVLLLAALALIALRRTDDVGTLAPPPPRDPLVAAVARVAAPVAVVAGAYLLWLGTTAPGGAFQAGAVLAAAAVLLRLAGYGLEPLLRGRVLRVLLVCGFALFVGVAVATAFHASLLEYPAGAAYGLVLLVEAGITLTVAVSLAALFAGAGPRRPAA